MEIDLVAHCGDRLVGAFSYTLTLTDIASTWTECVPLLVRTGGIVVETIDRLRGALPFRILGLDIDIGGEFLNETSIDSDAAGVLEDKCPAPCILSNLIYGTPNYH